MPAKAYRSIALLRSHASSPAVFWQKVTSESPSPAVCTYNSRASCGFFVTAVMSLFSESNAHCEVAEVLTMPRPGKLHRGPNQCERTCGHGNSSNVSQCRRRGGGLATGEHFLESEKSVN